MVKLLVLGLLFVPLLAMLVYSVWTYLRRAGGVYGIWTYVIKGSWSEQEARLGGTVLDTISEQEIANSALWALSTSLKVHVLKTDTDFGAPAVGIEVIRWAPSGPTTVGFGLTREEALALSDHLAVAVMQSRGKEPA